MKVSFNYENKEFKKHSDFVNKFIKLLQREFPLKNNLKILFLNQKKGEMSTGSRRSDNVIKVLVGDRMNRDIMRTLAHEWVHEHQMDVLNREKGPDIGGQNEDEANAFAGRLIKMFEKENPNYEPKMYESRGIEKKLNLLSEEILLTEKTIIKENLLVEMKKFGIEKLPYSYSSLSRFIDSKTMNVHYTKHYKGYVDKLNKALKDKDGDMTLEEIIRSISKFDNVVRNNAGGAFNHALFWKMLSPKKQRPHGEVYEKIKKDFGNIKKMKDEFNQAAKDRFGSGWAWLYLTKDGNLKIMSTPNQDNPLMNIVKKGGYPILGLDVWEHAYYLNYQNKRDEYIQKFWDVVNWDFVEELYLSKTKKDKKTIKEDTSDKEIINEISKTFAFPYTAKGLRELMHSQYQGCYSKQYKDGCLGRIETKKCTTELGVLGGDYSEKKFGGTSQWSIINRFDTNSRVKKEIYNIWLEETEGLTDFKTWIKDHAYDLFANDGMYLDRLAEPNIGTIEVGKENESYAKQIIRQIYKLSPDQEGISYELYEHCSGDINDRKKGQDIVLIIKGGDTIYFQVKPFLNQNNEIEFFDGGDRGYYFKVASWHRQTKYKGENVDVILYVDRTENKYIMFRNDHNKMLTVSNPRTQPPFHIFYYEMPLQSNFKIPLQKEIPKAPVKKTIAKDVKKEIEFYKERINYFTNKIKELGGENQDINEMINYYKKELSKIII
jgi:Fe-Mn family superoxide dismutase